MAFCLEKDVLQNVYLNQEAHHQKKTFAEEYEGFLNAHQFGADLAKANN